MKKQVLVAATKNKSNAVTICSLLKDYPADLGNPDDFDPVPDVARNGETFCANAVTGQNMPRMEKFDCVK